MFAVPNISILGLHPSTTPSHTPPHAPPRARLCTPQKCAFSIIFHNHGQGRECDAKRFYPPGMPPFDPPPSRFLTITFPPHSAGVARGRARGGAGGHGRGPVEGCAEGRVKGIVEGCNWLICSPTAPFYPPTAPPVRGGGNPSHMPPKNKKMGCCRGGCSPPSQGA